MRVFHFIKGLGRGGAESLLLHFLREAGCREHRHAFAYMVCEKDALQESLLAAGAERVVCLRGNGLVGPFVSVSRLRRELAAWGADIVHCHLPVSGVVGRWAAKGTRIPVVYTEHNLQERYHLATRWGNRLTWSWQERVIAVSGEVAASIRRSGLKGPPVRVIRNGVAVERVAAERSLGQQMRRELGIPPQSRVIGQVAVFRAQKRLDLWLEVVRCVRERRPDTHFLLVGDGPERSLIEQSVKELGLGEAVHLAGLQEDVRPFLAAMDVFLLTSDFEGLPVAVLEAMAARLPVVATKAGGTVEVVAHDETGFLTEVGAVEELSRYVVLLRDSAELRRRLGEAGRQRVATQFSTRRMVEETLALYREVLRERNLHQNPDSV